MSPITTERQGEILVVTSNNPPVNALSAAVRQGLDAAIKEAADDDAVKAVVIRCEGRTFFAGADITEFTKPPVEPMLPAVVDAIEASVKKTGRCLIVHEATRTSGFGAELSALVQERCFYHLEAPVERVTGFDTPYPHSLEWAYFPGPVRIGEAIKKIMKD